MNTFAQSHTILAMLSLSAIVLPTVEPWTANHVLLCIGSPPAAWTDVARLEGFLHYPHAESLSRLAVGHSVDFIEELPEECGAYISLNGLPCRPQLGGTRARKDLDGHLLGFRFACDLVRLSLRMWQRGLFAALELDAEAGHLSHCLPSLPGISSSESQGNLWLWNGPGSHPTAQFHPFN